MASLPVITDPVERAASAGTGQAPADWAALVPELSVSDIGRSVAFWCDLLGFSVAYDRPAARFSYLQRGAVQVMLCECNGRWETAALEKPFGRGINLQMRVEAVAPIVAALAAAGWPLYAPVTEARYRVGAQELGVREFLVVDPDGYLLRFGEDLGR
jgi:catechol 2,3-dioxygenase-like lactoylglutathione lyase family enzyme